MESIAEEFQTIRNLEAALYAKTEGIKGRLVNAVESLAHNGKVKYLKDGSRGGARIFLCKAANLGNNWSAEYHDTYTQAKAVREVLKGSRADSIAERIAEMIEKKKVEVRLLSKTKDTKTENDIVERLPPIQTLFREYETLPPKQTVFLNDDTIKILIDSGIA